jgi:large subunit ribosomal protein L19
MNLLEKYNQKQLSKLSQGKTIPQFRPGDTLRVHTVVPRLDVKSSKRAQSATRIQIFEGLCISRKKNGVASTFTVRKISHDEGVEKTLPLYSNIIDKIEVIRRGKVRRAKLFYIRKLRGKAMRVVELRDNRKEVAEA